MAAMAAPPQFKKLLPDGTGPTTANDIVLVAEAVIDGAELGISRSAWHSACQVMGSFGAALAVIIVQAGSLRDEERVRSPGGHLRGMTRRAEGGQLHLHRSIFGLLENEGFTTGRKL